MGQFGGWSSRRLESAWHQLRGRSGWGW